MDEDGDVDMVGDGGAKISRAEGPVGASPVFSTMNPHVNPFGAPQGAIPTFPTHGFDAVNARESSPPRHFGAANAQCGNSAFPTHGFGAVNSREGSPAGHFGAANARDRPQGNSAFPTHGFGAVNSRGGTPRGHFGSANAQGGPQGNSTFPTHGFDAVNVRESSPPRHFGSANAQGGNSAFPMHGFGAVNSREGSPAGHFGSANPHGGPQGNSTFPTHGFDAVNVREGSPPRHFGAANAQGGNSAFSTHGFGAVNSREGSPAGHFGAANAQDRPQGNSAFPMHCFGAANAPESPDPQRPGSADAATIHHHNPARGHDNTTALEARRVQQQLLAPACQTPQQHRIHPQTTPLRHVDAPAHHPSSSSTADPWGDNTNNKSHISDGKGPVHHGPTGHAPQDPWRYNTTHSNISDGKGPVHRAPTGHAPPDPWGYNTSNSTISDKKGPLPCVPADIAPPDPWAHNNNPTKDAKTTKDDPWGNMQDPWSAAPCNPWDKTDTHTSRKKTHDPWVDKQHRSDTPQVRPSQIGQLWGTQPAQHVAATTGTAGPTSQLPNTRKEQVCPGPASQMSRRRISEAPDIRASQLVKPKQVLLESWVTWLQALSWLDMPFDKFHLGRKSNAEKPPTEVKSFLAENNAQVILDRAYRDCCGTVPFMLVLVEEVVLAAYDIVVRARDPTGCIGLCLHRGFVQTVPSASHLGTVLFLRDVSFLRCPTNLQGDLETYCVVTMTSFVHAISQNDVPPDVTRELRARLPSGSQ